MTNNIDYVPIKRGPVIEAVYGLGKVKAEKFYEIKMSIIKEVEKYFVKEGSYVNKGDKLVAMVDGPVFVAPFSGTVTAINFSVSQQIFPQQTALRMDDIKNKYIEVSLEQQGALRVKAGLPVKVIFESLRGEVLKGKVESIFPQNDEFLAHISVDGLGDNILPGMTADVAIEIGRKDSAVLIPLSAISNGRIRLQRDNKKIVVPVKIGNVDGSWAEVLESELHDSDLIIIKKKN
jgi:multidrug efflux pump subunit AcrA (membrane-fusion protein)